MVKVVRSGPATPPDARGTVTPGVEAPGRPTTPPAVEMVEVSELGAPAALGVTPGLPPVEEASTARTSGLVLIATGTLRSEGPPARLVRIPELASEAIGRVGALAVLLPVEAETPGPTPTGRAGGLSIALGEVPSVIESRPRLIRAPALGPEVIGRVGALAALLPVEEVVTALETPPPGRAGGVAVASDEVPPAIGARLIGVSEVAPEVLGRVGAMAVLPPFEAIAATATSPTGVTGVEVTPGIPPVIGARPKLTGASELTPEVFGRALAALLPVEEIAAARETPETSTWGGSVEASGIVPGEVTPARPLLNGVPGALLVAARVPAILTALLPVEVTVVSRAGTPEAASGSVLSAVPGKVPPPRPLLDAVRAPATLTVLTPVEAAATKAAGKGTASREMSGTAPSEVPPIRGMAGKIPETTSVKA